MGGGGGFRKRIAGATHVALLLRVDESQKLGQFNGKYTPKNVFKVITNNLHSLAFAKEQLVGGFDDLDRLNRNAGSLHSDAIDCPDGRLVATGGEHEGSDVMRDPATTTDK